MNSRASQRALLITLSLVASIATFGCVAESEDDFVDENEEDISSSSEEIIGGTSVTAQYPEAGSIEGSGGTVPSGYVSNCSATLIAPKVILTAGHCVVGPTTWQVRIGSQSRTTVRAATFDWKNDMGAYINPNYHDIGLLFLDQAITIAAYPTIATTVAPSNAQLMNVGRVLNGTQTNVVWGAVTTGLSDGAEIGYPYAYITAKVIEGGDSGGPDFLLNTHKIVAVNSAGGLTTAYLARVDQINQWVTRPIDDSAFFVRGVYLDVLNREPDAGGQTFWVNTLNACNGASACLASQRAAIALSILKSAENLQQDPDLAQAPSSIEYKRAFVKHCYTNFLRRQPSTAERDSWVNTYNAVGETAVVSGFITSPEYRQRFGMQ